MEIWGKIIMQVILSALGTYLWFTCIAGEYQIAKTDKLKKLLKVLLWVGPSALLLTMIIDPIFGIYTWFYPAMITIFGGVFYSLIFFMVLHTNNDEEIRKMRGMTLYLVSIFAIPWIICNLISFFTTIDFTTYWMSGSMILAIPLFYRTFKYLRKSSNIDDMYQDGKITKEQKEHLHKKLEIDVNIKRKQTVRELKLNSLMSKNPLVNLYRKGRVWVIKLKQKYMI